MQQETDRHTDTHTDGCHHYTFRLAKPNVTCNNIRTACTFGRGFPLTVTLTTQGWPTSTVKSRKTFVKPGGQISTAVSSLVARAAAEAAVQHS